MAAAQRSGQKDEVESGVSVKVVKGYTEKVGFNRCLKLVNSVVKVYVQIQV